jgi:hypothetical protein
MRAATELPRARRAGSRRRRLAPNTRAPDPRILASKAEAPDDDLTERVRLIEFEWQGDHGIQPVILLSKTLLD